MDIALFKSGVLAVVVTHNGGGALGVLIFSGFLVFAVWSTMWHHERSRSLLEQWADRNGLKLLHSELRHFSRGPFFWGTGKGQTVYFVKVLNSQGQTRSGWVRCGSYCWGLHSDQTEVRWDV